MRKARLICFTLQIVFIFATVLAFTAVRAEDEEKDAYESADGATICNRCNCTNIDGTLEHGESGSLFTLDCSMKGLEKLFANWPEDMGDNHTSSLMKLT